MTHSSLRAHGSFATALLSVAMTVAVATFAVAPGGVPSVQAQACSPQIGIDAPSPGDTVSGSTSFSGWAVDLTSPGGSGVDQVRLYRDAPPEQGGTPLAVATVGVDRPDIDAANGLTGSMAGWTATVDFSDSPAGPSTIYIYAHTICGWTYATQVVSVDSSNVAAAPPAPAAGGPAISISMDTPTPGAIVNNGQALNVSGWAVDASGAGTGVDTVRLFLDGPEGTGQPLGWANYGRSRPDVVSMTGNTSWDKSGFDLVWPIAGVSPGSHVLYVYAHSTATGQWDYTTVPVTVTSAGAGVPGASATSANAAANPNAVVRVESPNPSGPLTGPTVVRGYAVDCQTGNPATTLRFYAGPNTSGKLLGTVTVGNGPRDLSQICSGRSLTGTSNAGFSFTVDPQSLAGAQSITIAADTMSGTGTTTLSFGGAANANAGTGSSDARCSAAAALSPFTVSCGTNSGTTTVTNSNPNAAPNPSATSSSYTSCAPNYQNTGGNPYGNGSNYMSAVQGNSPGCASTANNNYSACNPNYPQASPNYPNNVPCSSSQTAYNNAYNSMSYNNNGYNNNANYNAYTSYNGVNYPSSQYTNNGYNYNPQTLNGYNYNNGYNGYNYNANYNYNNGYNNGYPYYGSNNYPYTNSNSQYGYPYNTYNYGYNNSAYNYPYNGYNGYNYNNGYGYNGYNPYNGYNGYNYNGAYGQPYGYSPNYVYAGNAGAPYGNPYYNGYNGYGTNGYPYGNGYGGYPYGNPYGPY